MNFFLTMAFSFLVGLSDGSMALWEPDTVPSYQRIEYTHTDLNTEFRLHYADVGYLFVGGGVNVSSTPDGSRIDVSEYNPREIDFPFVAGLRIKDHIEIGYKYQCSHPMMTYLCDSSLKYKSEGAYSLVYVKLSGEVKLYGK